MNKKITLLSLFILISAACSEIKREKTSYHTISINLEEIDEPDFNDIFNFIEIYPLETNDSSLIGNFFNTKRAFYIPNKYYAVIDDNYIVHLFNLEGKYISNSSKCIGQGPQEYYILQDIAYNHENNTFDLLDPFGYITIFDPNFNFISKNKIDYQPKDRFRKIFALEKSKYALFDNTEKGSFTIYNIINNTTTKIEYPGIIADISSISSPFSFSNGKLYFTPPEINNHVFIYNDDKTELTASYYLDGGDKSINKSDLLNLKSLQEISEYILNSSPKYTSLDRLYGKKYIISTFIKQQQIFINICNIKTQNNKTFKKDKDIKINLPTFFSIEGNNAYAIIFPHELDQFTDKTLIINKDILQSIKDDDNPCIIKYNLKL